MSAIERLDNLISRLENEIGQSSSSKTNVEPVVASAPIPQKEVSQPITKETKQEAPKASSNNKGSVSFADFTKAHIQISKIVSIKKHPEADKLFACTIDTGSGTRSLCAGLVSSYKEEDLNGQLVVTILNLKPRKLKGVMSEAMILAADNTATGGAVILTPPSDSQVGERVFLEGENVGESVKVLSGTIWEGIVHDLKVTGAKATFREKNLVTNKGVIAVPGLPDGAGIH